MNISRTKLLKTLSAHDHTYQIETYCERKAKPYDGPLINELIYQYISDKGVCRIAPATPGLVITLHLFEYL